MSFIEHWQRLDWLQQPGSFDALPLAALSDDLQQFALRLQPIEPEQLRQRLAAAEQLTRQRFGLSRVLYSPLYVSNHCVNDCLYCGFASRHQQLPRLCLTPEQLDREAGLLASQGFGHVLLVAGDHPKLAGSDYYLRAVRQLRPHFQQLALEAQLLSGDDYQQLRLAGLDSVLLYQETYQRQAYQQQHPSGPKKQMLSRLQGPEVMARAGIERIGLGVLLGLAHWRLDALAVAAHLEYLQQQFPYSRYSLSLPRIQPTFGHQRSSGMTDHDFLQLVSALRLSFPWLEINLSTRESVAMRQLLACCAATHLSAASRTSPLGQSQPGQAEQFSTQDNRSLAEVQQGLQQLGLQGICHEGHACLGREPPVCLSAH